MLSDAEPNAAHYALAELEAVGLVQAVVTQNIDLLHERAGSREVVEVHGSIRASTCPQCGGSHGLERVLAMLRERPGEPPRCASCAGVLKPDVVFFGELLPEREVERAYELARSAGLMLGVGSSSVAGFLAAGGFRYFVIDGVAPGFEGSVTEWYTSFASAIGPLNVCTATCAARILRGNAAAARPIAGIARTNRRREMFTARRVVRLPRR